MGTTFSILVFLEIFIKECCKGDAKTAIALEVAQNMKDNEEDEDSDSSSSDEDDGDEEEAPGEQQEKEKKKNQAVRTGSKKVAGMAPPMMKQKSMSGPQVYDGMRAPQMATGMMMSLPAKRGMMSTGASGMSLMSQGSRKQKKKKKKKDLPPSSLMIYGTRDINMGMKIGAGGFADVYKAIFRNSGCCLGERSAFCFPFLLRPLNDLSNDLSRTHLSIRAPTQTNPNQTKPNQTKPNLTPKKPLRSRSFASPTSRVRRSPRSWMRSR